MFTQSIKVLSTDNYSMFKYIYSNRKINDKKVLGLMEIIKVTPNFFEVSPIRCTPTFSIWDGQHRLEAAKRLKIPVFYQVVHDVTIEQVRDMNNYKAAWTTNDYVNSHEATGNKNYQLFKEFQNTFGFDLSATLMLLSGRFSHNVQNTTSFKNGSFVVTHLEDAVNVANMINKIMPFHKHARSKHFIVAFNKLRTHAKFSFSVFMDKLEMNPKQLLRGTTTETYCETLCDMYNFRTGKAGRIDPRDLVFKGNNGK
jgi:hypothetical protein